MTQPPLETALATAQLVVAVFAIVGMMVAGSSRGRKFLQKVLGIKEFRQEVQEQHAAVEGQVEQQGQTLEAVQTDVQATQAGVLAIAETVDEDAGDLDLHQMHRDFTDEDRIGPARYKEREGFTRGGSKTRGSE